jgi:hypothetical protein
VLVELAICVVATAVVARAAGRWSRHVRERRVAACREIAARRGGVIDDAAATLTLQSGDARIVLCVAEVNTEIEVKYPVAAGPWFELQPRPIVTGSAFDQQYALFSLDVKRCQPMWSPRVASLLVRVLPGTTIIGRADSLIIRLGEAWLSGAGLEAALDLAAELGNTDLFGAAALRALPEAERCGTGRQACVRVAVGGAVVHFRPTLERGALATVASIDTADEDGAPFSVRLPPDDADALAASLPRPLPPDMVQRLTRVGPGVLSVEGRHAQFVWDGIERDAGQLLTAGRVVASFAAQPEAPYR